MTAPKHTHWGVYAISVIAGGVVLAALTLAARIAWEVIT